MNEEKLALLALNMLTGIGPATIRNLISYCGSAETVFEKNKGQLLKIPQIGPKTAELLLASDTLKKAEAEFRSTEQQGVQLLFFYSKEYPDRLKQIADAPIVLYYQGNADLNTQKVVAIVGTRQATEYGKAFTEEIVQQLIPHQPLIVSGLAYGIDIHAHKAALKYNLPTLGVLGSGVDFIYPAAHKDTARKMLETGGLLSEKPLKSKPEAFHFPERNRIIAGMADVVLVIEAAHKGGALLTAEIANSYDREVMAVPGNIHQTFSEGCNALISQNKAHLLSSVHNIEYIMNWSTDAPTLIKTPIWQREQFTDDEWKIITLLQEQKKEIHIDEMSWKTQIPIYQMASLLLNLEFKGVLKTLPGKMYKLSA